MKKRYWLAALLGLVLALMTITGRPAHAAAHRYMCPVDTYCQFSGDFYTGQVHEVDGITVLGNIGHWRQIPDGKRASANDNTAYQINYYSAATGQSASFHGRFEAGGIYGWWCSGPWSGCNHNLPGVIQKTHLTSAKRDTCPQGPPNWTACFWPNFDGTGTPYQAHPSGGLDQWRVIPSDDRASLTNLTQYTIWVYAVSGSGAGTYGCVDAGDFRVDGGVHGRFWMGDFGTCESGFQPLPPS